LLIAAQEIKWNLATNTICITDLSGLIIVKPPELSLVIPCYNESSVLPLLRERLLHTLSPTGVDWEAILVDDGSLDDTFAQLAAMHAQDPRFKVISFSRNFGHQTAVFAGLFHAWGNFVAVMDADLQDPPELLLACLDKLREGHDVVYAVRRQRKENFVKRICYSLFYRLLKSIAEVEIPLDSGDFCMMRQQVVSVLRQMPERNIFVRGLRAWSGFRQVGVEYNRGARAAGETKYPFRKLVRLAMDGIFAFSPLPLRMAAYMGFASLALSLMTTLFIAAWKILGFSLFGYSPSAVPGWTSLVCLMLFLNGIQFLILGVIGEFIGRIYNETKQRPRWIIRTALGIAETKEQL
jgi:glycosyltransferase involved in cell wall biosynthesis